MLRPSPNAHRMMPSVVAPRPQNTNAVVENCFAPSTFSMCEPCAAICGARIEITGSAMMRATASGMHMPIA